MSVGSWIERDLAEKRTSGLEVSALSHQTSWCPTVWLGCLAGWPEIPAARRKLEKGAWEYPERENPGDETLEKLLLQVAGEVWLARKRSEVCEHDMRGQTLQPLQSVGHPLQGLDCNAGRCADARVRMPDATAASHCRCACQMQPLLAVASPLPSDAMLSVRNSIAQ